MGADWYILVYGNFSPTPASFTIQAITSNVILTRVTPSEFGTDNTVELALSGAGFVPGATIQLLGGGNSVVASTTNTQVNSFTSLSATLSLAGVTAGTYSVRIILPDGSTNTLNNGFTVRASGVPQF